MYPWLGTSILDFGSGSLKNKKRKERKKKKEKMSLTILFKFDMQGVLLPDRQTLGSDSRHEDKHYWIGNHGAQMSSVGARGH